MNSREQSKSLAEKLRTSLGKSPNRETIREMQSHCIPTKRQSRIAAKITKNTSLSFNAAALKGVPGGHWTKMVTAVETGTQTLSFEGQAKLTEERSRKNCYTTKSAVHHFGA